MNRSTERVKARRTEQEEVQNKRMQRSFAFVGNGGSGGVVSRAVMRAQVEDGEQVPSTLPRHSSGKQVHKWYIYRKRAKSWLLFMKISG
jgi:hypothetical protein